MTKKYDVADTNNPKPARTVPTRLLAETSALSKTSVAKKYTRWYGTVVSHHCVGAPSVTAAEPAAATILSPSHHLTKKRNANNGRSIYRDHQLHASPQSAPNRKYPQLWNCPKTVQSQTGAHGVCMNMSVPPLTRRFTRGKNSFDLHCARTNGSDTLNSSPLTYRDFPTIQPRYESVLPGTMPSHSWMDDPETPPSPTPKTMAANNASATHAKTPFFLKKTPISSATCMRQRTDRFPPRSL